MTTQYDAIGSKYAVFKTLPTSIVERENVRQAVLPYLSRSPRPRVLDLACGTGYYTQRAVDWGTEYVLGVDISSGMVEAARDLASRDDRYAGGRVRFVVGDALSLGPGPGGGGGVPLPEGEEDGEGPFDVVIAAWLLNYAGGPDDMARMFRGVSANLKDGGVCVALVPPAAEDVDAVARRWMAAQSGFPASFPIRVEYLERLESGLGWRAEVSNNPDASGGDRISFRTFHLNKNVYEEAARRGGLGGELTWPEVFIPDEARGSLAEDVWEMYVRGGGHMGILVVEK